MIFPITFDNDRLKKEINLRVINQSFSRHVDDYSLVLPLCSVYQVDQNSNWQKLKIFGPLFVLLISDFQYPVIYILNTTSFEKLENFQLIFDKKNVEVSADDAKVFFKFKGGHNQQYCISTDTGADSQKLVDAIKNFRTNFSFDYSKDPTVKHLMSSFIKRH